MRSGRSLAGVAAMLLVASVGAGCSSSSKSGSGTSTSSTTSTTAASTTTSTARPTTTSVDEASLPSLTVGTWTGRRPVTLYFSGDSGNIATKLSWPVWDATHAVGHGQREELTCDPDCATGGGTTYPVTITLTDPVAGKFTTLTEVTEDGKGTTDTFHAPDLGQGACSTEDGHTCAY